MSQPLITALIPGTGFPELDNYRSRQAAFYSDDYGQRARYRQHNEALLQQNRSPQVVFFGDSITDGWDLAQSFPGKNYLNRGIGGQTTAQMLVRFRQDVLNLRPQAVVILAGTNDIAGNTGPVSNLEIEENIMTFAELATLHGIQVVISSVLPVHDANPDSQDLYAQRPRERLIALNHWLKSWSATQGFVWLDYATPMTDACGKLITRYSDDGLHPNAEGYRVMAPLAENAVQAVLSKGDGDSPSGSR